MDAQGNFAVTAPLVEGDNLLALTIMSGGEVVLSAEKHVVYDPNLATGGQRLLYVDSVAAGSGVPALPGTIVIALDQNTILASSRTSMSSGSLRPGVRSI